MRWIWLWFPIFSWAQEKVYRDVDFKQDLNLKGVKAIAKAQYRFIFIECYATWSQKCKLMDSTVFKDEKVAEYMNTHFVSMKVKMDTGVQRKALSKTWLNADADLIKGKYHVTTFPTYLFFSPDGVALHKGVGSMPSDQFINLAMDATDPEKQYYNLLKMYHRRKLPYAKIPLLATTAEKCKETNLATVIAQNYINRYLLKLEEKDLYVKDNISFISSFIRSSKDKGFRLFYSHADRIDSVMEEARYAQTVVDYFITKEEITPVLSRITQGVAEPDWQLISSLIKRNYDEESADRNILKAKVGWYEGKKEWGKYVKSVIDLVDKYGIDTTDLLTVMFLNNAAYNGICLHSSDEQQINIGINWMKDIVRRNPNVGAFLDTYAILLYKIGKTSEAIGIEKRAVSSDPRSSEIKDNLKRMEEGDTAWIPAEGKNAK